MSSPASSDIQRTYAVKALNVMACIFVTTYQETMQKYGSYNVDQHNQLYLSKFKVLGYAGSRMDDLLPFYEMFSNTINTGVSMRKFIENKIEKVTNSQLGFADFVDDNTIQVVPISKLDEYISNECKGDYLDIPLKADENTVTSTENKPWYKNMKIWYIVIGVTVSVVIISGIIWMLTHNTTPSYVGGRYKKVKQLKF
jgi:hypothetical protein